MMTENLLNEILGEDAPVMTDDNRTEIAATFQYVLHICCTERERSFLMMRYGRNMTYPQIAEEAFLSVERVRQLVIKSLKKMGGYREMLQYGLKGWHRNEIRRLEEQYAEKKSGEPETVCISETYAQMIGLEELSLSARAYNGLRRAGIHTLAELTQCTAEKLTMIRHLGEKTVAEIISRVHFYGLKLADES